MANYLKLAIVNILLALLCFFERPNPEGSQFVAVVFMFLAGALSGYLIVEKRSLRKLALIFLGLVIFLVSWLVAGFAKDYIGNGKLGSEAVSFALIALIFLTVIGGPIYIISGLIAMKAREWVERAAQKHL